MHLHKVESLHTEYQHAEEVKHASVLLEKAKATEAAAAATAAAAAAAATATAAAAAAEWGRGVVDAERRRLEAAESQKRQSELAAIALDEARARRVAFSYTKRMQVLPLFAMSLSIACEVV